LRKLYLFGDFTENFKKTCKNFITSSGGNSSEIALLMQGENGWQKFYDQYYRCFKKWGVEKVFPIFPERERLSLSKSHKDEIKRATGIFICGGYTYRYIKIYTQPETAELIRLKYLQGIPYAGLSAGAILSLRLGLLPNCSLKPHFSKKKRFFELIKKMKATKSAFGLGIDSGICLEIIDERDCKLYGEGYVYLFHKKTESSFEMNLYKPSKGFICNFSDPKTMIR